jgi:DNA replication protein DnaC
MIAPGGYERADAYTADALHRAAIESWELNCPTDYKVSDFSDPAHPRVAACQPQINEILAWRYGPRGILATGSSGKGKTRAMWQLTRKLAYEHQINTRYYHSADWFAKLHEQVNYGRDEARGWVESAARRKLVFIDDFGQEAIQRARQDWAFGWFMRFLDIRVGEKLPLLVTTNFSAETLAGTAKELQSDPLIRRLIEVCKPVKF